jgi:hypothetical protein
MTSALLYPSIALPSMIDNIFFPAYELDDAQKIRFYDMNFAAR